MVMRQGRTDRSGTSIPEDVMLGRLAQSEQTRESFIQMWLQNPLLAKQAGRKVQDILSLVFRPAGGSDLLTG